MLSCAPCLEIFSFLRFSIPRNENEFISIPSIHRSFFRKILIMLKGYSFCLKGRRQSSRRAFYFVKGILQTAMLFLSQISSKTESGWWEEREKRAFRPTVRLVEKRGRRGLAARRKSRAPVESCHPLVLALSFSKERWSFLKTDRAPPLRGAPPIFSAINTRHHEFNLNNRAKRTEF